MGNEFDFFTEIAAFVLTLVTCGALAGVSVAGIVLMKRVMRDETPRDLTVEAVPDTEPTRPGRGAV